MACVVCHIDLTFSELFNFNITILMSHRQSQGAIFWMATAMRSQSGGTLEFFHHELTDEWEKSGSFQHLRTPT